MKFIIGKKLEMTQRFGADGRVVPVTLVSVGPCVVTQVRTASRDGYTAVQVGYLPRRKLTKSEKGHLHELESFGTLREFRLDDTASLNRGDRITAEVFVPGDVVEVEGLSKGQGFQGVVKRHGFAGHPSTHGHKDQLRMPGSIGSKRQGPVAKGKRMAGRMGGEQVTVKNLKIVDVDAERGVLAIAGAIPGARGTTILLRGPGEMELRKPVSEEVVAAEPETAPVSESNEPETSAPAPATV